MRIGVIVKLYSPAVKLWTSPVFFFSSRRRHTRCLSDWSSDVCSSDLSASPGRRRAGPIDLLGRRDDRHSSLGADRSGPPHETPSTGAMRRSEEHTSELQSLRHLVCRLLLE